MIYITGDTHSDFRKFNTENFPEQMELDKEDYVIICGDFGGIWDPDGESKQEKYWLDWLENKNYTTLFVDGNHENFKRLYGYPIRKWHGGLVHEIRPSVLHLARGQVYELAGNRIFTMGGASSHDILGGILDKEAPDFTQKKKELDREYITYRIKNVSWWEEEQPSKKEYDEALRNLEKTDFKVDYIISHCCSTDCQSMITPNNDFKADELTDFFNQIREKCSFQRWYFGHYHMDLTVTKKETVLYKQILPLGETVEEKKYVPGYPRFRRGDVVEFWWDHGSERIKLCGTVEIVDKYGSFHRPDEASYDICALYDGEEMLFKHVAETDVIGKFE